MVIWSAKRPCTQQSLIDSHIVCERVCVCDVDDDDDLCMWVAGEHKTFSGPERVRIQRGMSQQQRKLDIYVARRWTSACETMMRFTFDNDKIIESTLLRSSPNMGARPSQFITHVDCAMHNAHTCHRVSACR